ncbi:MAG: hypothetical protein IOC96_08565, partial [Rhodobacter sp.]|nr:hypothetical protein [Rhodobacter sp.]
MQKSYYQSSIADFKDAQDSYILGELTRSHGFALEHQQRQAWIDQIHLLKDAVSGLRAGNILFESSIPRMGKRADVLFVLPSVIAVIEFKVGASTFDRAAIDQVHDYALDLKNFHGGSHDAPIIPVLFAT